MKKMIRSNAYRIRYLLLLVGGWMQCLAVFAQPPNDIPTLHFHQIQDGLSQSNVKSIVQDHRGFLWLGTEGGLNRFDGLNFRIFEMDESDSTSLPDNRINDLLIDSQQNLWIATYHALALYVEAFEKFLVINKEVKEGEEPYLDALTLFEDTDQQLWVGTHDGVFVLDAENQILKRSRFQVLHQLDQLYVHAIEEVAGTLWFGTNNGLYVLDRNTHTLKKVLFPSLEDWEGEISDLFKDRQGRIWIATTKKGLLRIDGSSGSKDTWQIRNFFAAPAPILNDHRIFTIFEDSQDRIWVGTESMGLNLYVPNTDSFVAFTSDPSEENALKTNSIWEIFEDTHGRLYLGSNNQGMFLHDPYLVEFNHIDPRYGLRLKFGTVTSFLEDGENMWIGTDGGGISIWNRNTHSFSFLHHDPNQTGTLGSDAVLTLFRDSQGVIWTGNWNGGLNRYDPATGAFQSYRSKGAGSLGSNNVMQIQEDKNGDLWMCTWGHGVSRYNRATDDFFQIGYIPFNDDLLSHKMTYDVEIDDLTGEIWVATVLGLDRITMEGKERFSIKHFRYDEEENQSLSAHNVHCIYEDDQHRLWIGTSNGLNLYDRTTEEFTRFYSQQGLPSNVIQDIIQDERGDFWVTTSKGLAKMSETEDGFRFEVYEKADGLQADEFFRNASYLSHSGELFLGGVNGFNHFDPRKFREIPDPPNIQFIDFQVFNQEVEVRPPGSQLLRHINSAEEIILERSQSSFFIEFQGVNMTNPEKHQYAYKLEGFDEKWMLVGPRNLAIYTNLDAGEYVFKVQGGNRDGRWNQQPREIKIIVQPPWYQSWWGKLVFVVSPLIFLFSLIQIRFALIKSQKKQLTLQVTQQTAELQEQKDEIEMQAEQLKKVNQQKNKLFSIISHDLRSPIYSLKGVMNMLDPSILEAEDLNNIKEKISQRIESIGEVMVNVLDWSASQLEGENSQIMEFDLSCLSKEICNLNQQVALEKQVRLVNGIAEPVMVKADPNQIRVVFRNLIGNALKFTHPEDVIKIDWEINNDQEVIIHVSDTGIGMEEEKRKRIFDIACNRSTKGTAGEKGVGLGLVLVKEFIEKNGGSVSVESTLGEGTTFSFTLPRA